jgi:hypothetical protein
MHRFTQTVDDPYYAVLLGLAKELYPGEAGVVQKLIRRKVIPDWIKQNKIIPKAPKEKR